MPSEFPAWFYGPNGAARIFETADEIPDGWADSPAKIGTVTPLDHDRDGKPGGSLPRKRKRK